MVPLPDDGSAKTGSGRAFRAPDFGYPQVITPAEGSFTVTAAPGPPARLSRRRQRPPRKAAEAVAMVPVGQKTALKLFQFESI